MTGATLSARAETISASENAICSEVLSAAMEERAEEVAKQGEIYSVSTTDSMSAAEESST